MIEDKVNVAVPLFVSVIACASEVVPWGVVGKVRLVALNFTVGGAVPIPVRVTTIGEPTLAVTVVVPESAAAEAGLNATYIEQEAPAASVLPQVPTSSKELALVPPSTIDLSVTVAAPAFFTVTV
jgi:hypothetical protein